MSSAAPARGLGGRVFVMRVVHAAIVIGAALFLLYAYHVREDAPAPEAVAEKEARARGQVTNILLGVSVLSLLLAWLVPGQVALSARMKVGRQLLLDPEAQQGPIERDKAGTEAFWAAQYLVVFVVRLALLEAGAFALIIAHLIDGPANPFALDQLQRAIPFYGALGYLAYILTQFPTLTKVLYWAETQRAMILRDRVTPSSGGSGGLFDFNFPSQEKDDE